MAHWGSRMRSTTTRPNPAATYTPGPAAKLPSTESRSLPISRVLWLIPILALAAYFAWRYALHYFHYTPESYGSFFWARARWLLPHVTAGMVALFLGPLQFWSAFRARYARLHRWSGRTYVAGVALGATMAFGLVARMPSGGLAHASGLGALAVAWVVTTGMAFIAIRRGNIEQHRDWMIRSYVVTFAFVTYRLLIQLLQANYPGNDADLRGLVSWACWSVPLLATEVVLQGSKIVRAARRPVPALPD